MKKSFTLIELLVVIAIIGILSSLVIARFSNWNDEARIANTLQWSSGVNKRLGANLVGYWPLNDGSGTTAKDISGYNNNISLHNFDFNESSGWKDEGVASDSGSLLFDGVNDFLRISLIDISKLNNATVSFWRKNVNSTQWLLFQGTGTGGYLMAINTGSFYHSNVGSSVVIYEDGKVKTTETRDGRWHHYVATGFDISSWGSIVYLSNYGNYHYNGYLSELKIYDTALTAEEVSRIYAESKDQYLAYE